MSEKVLIWLDIKLKVKRSFFKNIENVASFSLASDVVNTKSVPSVTFIL